MKSLKVVQLIKSLKPGEKKHIELDLLHHRQGAMLEKLFKLIAHTKATKLDKPLLFEQLYDEPYEKSKDYLIRNIFRNLTRKIEAFLVDQAFHREIHKNLNTHNYFLLKSFQHLKLHHLFDLEANHALHQAEKTSDFLTASHICGLQVNNHLLHLIPNEENAQKAIAFDKKQMLFLSAFYLNAYYHSQNNRLHLKKLIHPELHEKEIIEIPIERHIPALDNAYTQYLRLKTTLFFSSGTEKIATLQECLNLLSQETVSSNEIKEEIIFCKTALAHEYSLTTEFTKANDLYQALLQNHKDLDSPILKSTVCDYLNNLVHQNNFKKARTLIDKYLNIFEKDPAHYLKLEVLKMMIFAFLKDANELNKLLPNSLKGLPEQENYLYRFLFSIEFFLHKNYEQAHRECINFRNTLRNKVPHFDIRDILNFFIRFYYLMSKQNDNLKKSLKKLDKDIAIYISHAPSELVQYLPFIWLKREVQFVLNFNK